MSVFYPRLALRRLRALLLIASAFIGLLNRSVDAQQSWQQWGGPDRNFRLGQGQAPRLPKDIQASTLWKRSLGGGYGGIAISEDRVFTLIREGEEEVVYSLSLTTGETLWRSSYRVADEELEYGMGPFSTPIVHNGYVITLGVTGVLRSMEVVTGKVVWERDLRLAYPPIHQEWGFASSPIILRETLFAMQGSEGAAFLVLNPADGALVSRRYSFPVDYASPISVWVNEKEQVICHMEEQVVGLDADTLELKWSLPSRSDRTRHVISPVVLEQGEMTADVLLSTTYGVRRVRIADGKPQVMWTSSEIEAQIGNLIYLPSEEMILGAKGVTASAPLVALDAATGKRLWRSRELTSGFMWSRDRMLFSLAPDGELAMSRPRRSGVSVQYSTRPLQESKVWSAPAMVGDVIVLKGQSKVLALKLVGS
jgi:outer membrane protein assembly factor BamB